MRVGVGVGIGFLPLRAGSGGGGGGGGGGGAAPIAPVIYIVGSPIAFNPEMNAVGQFVPGDTVQVEYQSHGAGWVSPIVSTHVITSNEIGGLQWGYVITPDLATGDYDWRIKFKHAGGAYSNYSNELQFTIPLPSPTVSYRGNGSHTSGTGTFNTTIDIGTASADRLVVVGLTSAGAANGTTNLFDGPVIVNGVSLTKRYAEETDRHKSWWTGIVPTGDGVVNMSIASVGNAAQPKIHFVWTLKNYNSATHKAVDGKGSNFAAIISVDVGDAVLAIAHPNNTTFLMNPRSTETFTTHQNDNGSSFTNYGSIAHCGELLASATRSFSLILENPASPGNNASGGKSVIAFR